MATRVFAAHSFSHSYPAKRLRKLRFVTVYLDCVVRKAAMPPPQSYWGGLRYAAPGSLRTRTRRSEFFTL